MSTFCFLDTSVLATMSMTAEFRIKGKTIVIRHVFFSLVEKLLDKISKNINLALTSSTVVAELNLRFKSIIKDVIDSHRESPNDDWKSVENKFQFATIADEFLIQSNENFEKVISYITVPSYDNRKSFTLKDIIENFLMKYYDELKKKRLKENRYYPGPPRGRDAKIVADACVIFEDKKREFREKLKFYFVTIDTFFTSVNPECRKIFYDKYGFNFSFWPDDVVKLL